MNRKVLTLLAVVLALCLALTACGDKDKDKGDDVLPSGGVVTDAPAETKEPTDYSKYNTYIELADEMAEMEDILYVYFNNVAYQEEFALAEGGDYANIKDAVQFYTGLSYTAEKALDYADEAPSYPELDAAVLVLGDSPAKVMDALDHLGSYMRFDEFQEDSLGRAPEIHAELWAALETYDQYYPQFLSALDAMAQESEETELNDLLEEGELIRYNARTMIRTAESIQSEIFAQVEAAAEDAGEEEEISLPPIDPTNLSPLFAKFQTAYEDLTAALADEEQQEKISAFNGRVGEESLKLYTNRVNTLYIKVGALAQALLDNADYAEAYEEVSEAITDMINTYNNYNS